MKIYGSCDFKKFRRKTPHSKMNNQIWEKWNAALNENTEFADPQLFQLKRKFEDDSYTVWSIWKNQSERLVLCSSFNKLVVCTEDSCLLEISTFSSSISFCRVCFDKSNIFILAGDNSGRLQVYSFDSISKLSELIGTATVSGQIQFASIQLDSSGWLVGSSNTLRCWVASTDRITFMDADLMSKKSIELESRMSFCFANPSVFLGIQV